MRLRRSYGRKSGFLTHRKEISVKVITFKYLYPHAPLALAVRVSNEAGGVALNQLVKNSRELVAFFKQPFNSAETRHSMFHRELLAFHLAVEHFTPWWRQEYSQSTQITTPILFCSEQKHTDTRQEKFITSILSDGLTIIQHTKG